MVSPTQCMICGGTEMEEFLWVNGTHLKFCADCKLVVTVGTGKPIEEYYRAGSFQAPTSTTPRESKSLLAKLEQYKPSGKILDVGCWFGGFLQVARERGWDVYGIELNECAAHYVSDTLGIPVFRGTISAAQNAFPKGVFDVVTLFHVLEHLEHPLEDLGVLRSLLPSDGILAVRVPNIESLCFRILRRHWGHLAHDNHMFHFSCRTLSGLLKKSRYEVVFLETRNCSKVHEVWELIKGVLKTIGFKPSHGEGSGVSGETYTGFSLPNIMNHITRPLFWLSYPFWWLCALRGFGTEIFVVARKKAGY